MTDGEQAIANSEPPYFGARIQKLRQSAGLTQEELAERAGLTAAGVSALERGHRRRPHPHTVRALAAGLGLPEAYLTTLLVAAREGASGAITPTLAGVDGSLAPAPLPVPLTSFVGRQHVSAELQRLLRTTRLLTLTGVGGIGKTRLALRVAAEVSDLFPDGVFLIELAPVLDAGLVPQTVAAVLRIPEHPAQPMTTLVTALRTQQALLVLDNCEHLVAACAEFAETLLRACPGITLLTTSREALGVPGEITLRVPTLKLPEPGYVGLERVKQVEAVQLFLERAAAIRPDFDLVARDVPAIVEICRRLDGIPLALELAAAWVGVLSPKQICNHLDARFQLLTTGGRTAPARQRTLRATVQWSYDLLTPTEQRFFRRLAVFMGGWTLEAVENVCGADGLQRKSVLDLLAKLVAKCLVVAEPTSQAHMRYRLLETLREYAWEQLVTSGESEPTLRRHARYFGQLAEEAEPALLGRGQVSILERLDQERDNMRTVLRWAVKRSEIDAGVRLTGALWRFWRIRGPLSEGLAWLDEFLGQSDPNGPPSPERAKALVGAAALSRILADLNLASDRFEEALAILRKLDDKKGIGFVLLGLGLIAISRRELGRAAEFLEQSVAVRRQVGDRPGLAFSLASLGNVVRRQGDLPRAKTLVEQSLALRRESGERQATGAALIVLAQIERQQGEPERARALLREGIGLFHEMGDTRGTAWAFAEQARLERETGDDESATQLYEVSLRLNRDCGDTVGLVACLNGLAALVAARGGFECAARLLGAASGLAELSGFSPSDDAEPGRTVAAVRTRLGGPVFKIAWAAGRGLSVEQAIAEALDPAPPKQRQAAALHRVSPTR
jgi:non-specific serine/threonine protein kinase